MPGGTEVGLACRTLASAVLRPACSARACQLCPGLSAALVPVLLCPGLPAVLGPVSCPAPVAAFCSSLGACPRARQLLPCPYFSVCRWFGVALAPAVWPMPSDFGTCCRAKIEASTLQTIAPALPRYHLVPIPISLIYRTPILLLPPPPPYALICSFP